VTTQTEINQRNHHRAVRFFWGLLIGATLVSLIGNITHAVVPYIPHVVIQIGAAAVPPIALLARCARHRPRRPCGSIWQGLLLCGQRRGGHRRRRIRPELPGTA
jgi:hypothetical protein